MGLMDTGFKASKRSTFQSLSDHDRAKSNVISQHALLVGTLNKDACTLMFVFPLKFVALQVVFGCMNFAVLLVLPLAAISISAAAFPA